MKTSYLLAAIVVALSITGCKGGEKGQAGGDSTGLSSALRTASVV